MRHRPAPTINSIHKLPIVQDASQSTHIVPQARGRRKLNIALEKTTGIPEGFSLEVAKHNMVVAMDKRL